MKYNDLSLKILNFLRIIPFSFRIEHQNFVSPSQKKIEIITIASNYHIEVNPSDVGIYDRVVIQELIKTVASSNQLNKEGQREFKVVVLTEVDKLTKDAQHALRRTMEKYMATCRVILITNSTSKVIPAIRYGVYNDRTRGNQVGHYISRLK